MMKISLLFALLIGGASVPLGTTVNVVAPVDLVKELGLHDVQPINDTGFPSKNGRAENDTELGCDFEQEETCCWKNGHEDRMLNIVGASAIDIEHLKNMFHTETAPKGKFATTFILEGDPNELNALYVSCALECVADPPIVQAKVWKTDGTVVEACIMPHDGEPHSCKPFEGAGRPPNMEVQLSPFAQPHHLVIQAKGFREKKSVVIIDDIVVYAPLCQPPPPPICDLQTNFYDGLGFWQQSQTVYTEVDFESNEDKDTMGNPNTGVKVQPGVPESHHFVGAVVAPGERGAIQSPSFRLNQHALVKFWYQEVVEGASLKCCISDIDERDCHHFQSNIGIKDEDRKWKEAKITLEPDDRERVVVFICDNRNGSNHGACGVGDVKITDKFGVSLCTQW